ncbi:RNA-directed DNA polymerase, eukaryota, Reverse transcriptase zinc-binding domain protein [Artemisia annua]|uniref:RNA-directed DNA polymerase, eukaryota, Reverse transcriptase zinc-binding domain protein n=1 Tax=Artemisia annua TaxID=35608 RepID=A0A2U1N4W7_ARTAN|nr:RNA-directed DNA polymerase, eukaryota, Reverse transcriptase zinc-binding domain protein [Artemisia annua]
MNFLSINIRGIGSRGKPGWVNKLKSEFGVSFIGLQETMSSNVSPGMIVSYWGGLGFEYESVNSEGNSGGILSVWDPKFLLKDTVMKDSNFLLVSGLLGDGNSRINIMNVYAPQSNNDKRNLWDKIIRVIQAGRGWWIIFGDFNAVREPDERKNSVFDPGCARDFNDFVEEAGLREFDLKGLKYTYLVNRCGEFKMSRIDRVFVCDNIFNKWSNAYVRALRRELSDHTPLLLSLVDTNFGPKPFRWFDSWLERPGCVEVINSVMDGWIYDDPPELSLIQKLKMLRDKLKVWKVLMEQQELEEADFWVWSECTKCLQEIEFYRSRDFRQKSRVKWASLGDENSSYFHNVVKGRQARNAIPSLEVRGEWISEPAIIKREVLRFFRNHFKEALPVRPNILCTGCWRQIVKTGEKRIWNGNTLNSYFVGIVGDGSSINFWTDSWLHNEPLRFAYPNLFRIERKKWATVSERLLVVNDEKIMNWHWTTAPSSAVQVTELFSLLSDIYDYDWKGGSDEWKWTADDEGVFSVKQAKVLMSSGPVQQNIWCMNWKGWAPLKCKVMAWRAAINRLPTKLSLNWSNAESLCRMIRVIFAATTKKQHRTYLPASELVKRGVPLPNDTCDLCSNNEETTSHLFTGCMFAAEIWSRMETWCRLSPIFAFEVVDLLTLADVQQLSKTNKHILKGILITALLYGMKGTIEFSKTIDGEPSKSWNL